MICDKLESVWNRVLLCGVEIHHLIIIELGLSVLIAAIHVAETVFIKVLFVSFIKIHDYVAFCIMIACISMIGSLHGLILAIFSRNLQSMISTAFGLMFIFFFSNGTLQ